MTKHLKTVNLYGVAMLLLMTACSPKVVTHISKVYPDIIPTDSVYVIELGDKVPNTAETIGRISVVDRGTSSKCRYDQVLHLAQEATGKNGGNGLVITDHLKPSFWGSSATDIRLDASPFGPSGGHNESQSGARHDRTRPCSD